MSAHYWYNTWWGLWGYVLLVVFAAIVATKMPRKLGFWEALLTVSTVFGAFWAMTFVTYPITLSMYEKVSIHADAGYTLVAAIALGALFYNANSRLLLGLTLGLGWVALVEACVIIWQRAAGQPAVACGGFLGNPSLAACYVAVAATLLKPSWSKATLCFAAILCTGSSVGVATFGVCYFVAVAKRRKHWHDFTVTLVFTGSGALVVHLTRPGHTLLMDSGRFYMWKLGMRYWWDNFNLLHGAGVGVTLRVLPLIQVRWQNPAENQLVGLWMWFHNDWLQILFEQGVIGFSAAVGVAQKCVRGAWADPSLLAALVGSMFAMCFNPMLHMPLHALLAATILARSLKCGRAGF